MSLIFQKLSEVLIPDFFAPVGTMQKHLRRTDNCTEFNSFLNFNNMVLSARHRIFR